MKRLNKLSGWYKCRDECNKNKLCNFEINKKKKVERRKKWLIN
ncbi:MAG: hypothetical protein AABW51_01875 [Nanoarchaeota archaeon]